MPTIVDHRNPFSDNWYKILLSCIHFLLQGAIEKFKTV